MKPFIVFAQDASPRIRAIDWRHNAERFFDVKLDITETSPTEARITIDGASRTITGRARTDEDLRDALAGDNGGGLYDLADRRCKTVWCITRESVTDRTSLTIAAILASVHLGPILTDTTLIGVRSARIRLSALDEA